LVPRMARAPTPVRFLQITSVRATSASKHRCTIFASRVGRHWCMRADLVRGIKHTANTRVSGEPTARYGTASCQCRSSKWMMWTSTLAKAPSSERQGLHDGCSGVPSLPGRVQRCIHSHSIRNNLDLLHKRHSLEWRWPTRHLPNRVGTTISRLFHKHARVSDLLPCCSTHLD
jgi:hypothetical protein